MEAQINKVEAYASLAKINNNRMHVQNHALRELNSVLRISIHHEMQSGVYSDHITLTPIQHKLFVKNRIIARNKNKSNRIMVYLNKLPKILFFFLK